MNFDEHQVITNIIQPCDPSFQQNASFLHIVEIWNVYQSSYQVVV